MTVCYKCFQTDEFKRKLKKLDFNVQKRIDKAIVEILFVKPYATKILTENLKGKRSLRVGDYRVIIAICEECKRLNYVELNGCRGCKKHGRNDIIMFTCGHRDEVYEQN